LDPKPPFLWFIRHSTAYRRWPQVGLLIYATILFPDLTPGNLLAGLGIGSIAIGLAIKNIFVNFIAGIFILPHQTLRIGD
jgi:small conductance mechanosensitive channel